ncbi:MAG: hypothetical protein WC769_07705 [Thermodesulfovibrionales bacterium]|jgi:hypothetical protein
MPPLDWASFYSLPGSKSRNFENLCRALIRLHFGQYGQFAALKNQPGVEFHLKLITICQQLGGPPRWYGWQCKFHERTIAGDLNAASRTDIKDSLAKAEKYLPDLTDWVLWTPYTLSKNDQEWFKALPTKFTLQQWVEEDIDTYLNGPGLMLRSTYFGDLVMTPEVLDQQHREATQPIKERWLEPVHQSVEAERIIRRMLGEPGSWKQMITVGQNLKNAADVISKSLDALPPRLERTIPPFVAALSAFADTLLHFHEILSDGDLDVIQQKLHERKSLIDANVAAAPRRLRPWNLPIALDATNALDDMRIAQSLLDEAEEFLGVGLVSVLADAGGGKTQMAAHLTAHQNGRPAGILLHGRDLHKGEILDDLARHFKLNGNPLTSMERLLSGLDAAGKRARCRLPVVIDGLNEAENPKDWKAPLAILDETIKRYPNVLVVCTLRTGEHRRERAARRQTNARESFAVMALPHGIKQIESEGFGGDVREAIKKYFIHFKINPGDAEIPTEFLQHPLTLRIFCEVTNPKKESEVKVDYFPAALSPLLEKYVANVCERISQMPNLSHPYTRSEVETAIYKFGLVLWNAKKREISEAAYKKALSDTTIKWDKWDSNIVNLLAQEGIVFRNPGNEPDQFAITPIYDALGGYIVANFLIVKHKNDRKFEWLKKSKVIESFDGENSHSLAADIFRSLVALTPRRMQGSQLWKETPDIFRNVALRFAAQLEAKYLDDDTTRALFDLLRDNPSERPRLFNQLRGLRAAQKHPLNSDFLDTALRALSTEERDLSWTEWIRGNRGERFNDLLSIESLWKKDLLTRTPSDRLRAKWVMWLLTSTDHELRDVATRAMYWFGRGDPLNLFDLTLKALEINDPYVVERLIAASYGIVMAFQHDEEFLNNLLLKYARSLFDNLFAKNAKFSTTHILMRDYAKHTIDIALLHKGVLLNSNERQRITPSFEDAAIEGWGRAEDKNKNEYRDGNYPSGFDFNNYTMGRLIPKRRNYDFDDPEYLEVKSKMWWRIYSLGYSLEKFGEIDKNIARERYGFGRVENSGKIDRYGKKYCWIAYYEIAGYRQDKGLLKNEWESGYQNRFTTDIDPSFPAEIQKIEIIKSDFLKSRLKSLPKWITLGPPPDISPFTVLGTIQDEPGPWVLIDGFIEQENLDSKRDVFIFTRGLLVKKEMVSEIIDRLTEQDVGGRWLPEIPELYYIFAGEIPWCETFPYNGVTEISFIVGTKKKRVPDKKTEFLKDGVNLMATELKELLEIMDEYRNEKIAEEAVYKYFSKNKIRIRNIKSFRTEIVQKTKEYEIRLPVATLNMSEAASAANHGGHAYVLSKELCESLNLTARPQTFDFYDETNRRASFTLRWGEDWHSSHKLIYLRKDLLDRLLQKERLALIWCIWGERRYKSRNNYGLQEFAKGHGGYKVFQEVLSYKEVMRRLLKKRV